MFAIWTLVFMSDTVSLTSTCSEISLPFLNNERYASFGDLNIGGLFSITDVGQGLHCSKKIREETNSMEFVEAFAFAVKKVNEDKLLLPNFKLGFVILDYCRRHNTAIARSLSFLPGKKGHVCQRIDNSTLNSLPIVYYDVMGVIGLYSSLDASLVSSLYAVAKLPLISFLATSDLLSDKSTHPYFLRVVPPDIQQVLAMLAFIANNNWSYISITYTAGSYGQSAFEHFYKFAGDFGICFASIHKLTPRSDTDTTVKTLLAYPSARVVVMFSHYSTARKVIKSSTRLGAKGHFIWIGSDALSDKLISDKELTEEIVGSFVFMFHAKGVTEFTKYFNDINVSSSENPWLRKYWEYHGKCSFENGSCEQYRNPSDFDGFENVKRTSLVIDSVLTFAHASHKLIKDRCPFANKAELKQCVNGEILLNYLKNTSFDGYTGKIQFDSNGDYMGKYEVRQIKEKTIRNRNLTVIGVKLHEEPIATFDIVTQKIIYNGRPISWDHLGRKPTGNANRKPNSMCSKPCGIGQYKLLLNVPCCWECRRCRINERVTEDGVSCETCEELTWPDPDTNRTSCSPITVQFPYFYSKVPMAKICLAIVAILILLAVIYFYVNNRENRVIKASSRELSYLQMTGIMLRYISVIVFQFRPNDVICGCLYFMYCLSFAWLYSPLIVKSIRIYRIFESAKHNTRPRFISPQAQLLFAIVLIAIQVIICIVVYTLYKPRSKIRQPNPMEKFVEISCDMTLPGLGSFLGYNLLLVAMCSYFAFKTRKLPENFNESLFISMCVSTTLIVWMSFIATFLTATRDNVRVILLSMSLLLNHTVAIVFLFLPKIYAVMVVDPLAAFTFSPTTSPHFYTMSKPSNIVLSRSS